MTKKTSAKTVIRELGFLLEGFPNLTVEELGEALREAGDGNTGDPNAAENSQSNRLILGCAKAFGRYQQFESKKEALDILQEELGLRLPVSIAWKHIVGAVAVKLLEMPEGIAKAESLIRRHNLKVPGAKKRKSAAIDGTLEMVQGIIGAKST